MAQDDFKMLVKLDAMKKEEEAKIQSKDDDTTRSVMENLEKEIACVEGRLMGCEEVLTVSSLAELRLLKVLHSRGVYLGGHVRCLPFETKEKMEHHVIMCTEFALEVISPEANVDQQVMPMIAMAKAYGIPAANPAMVAAAASSTDSTTTEEVDYPFSCWF